MLAFLVHYLSEIVKFCMIITFDHTSTVTFDYSGVRRKLENCGLMTSYSNFCNGYRYGHCYKHKALTSTSTYAMEKTYDIFYTYENLSVGISLDSIQRKSKVLNVQCDVV